MIEHDSSGSLLWALRPGCISFVSLRVLRTGERVVITKVSRGRHTPRGPVDKRGERERERENTVRDYSHDHVDLSDLAFKDLDDANHRCPYRFRLVRVRVRRRGVRM